MNDAISLPIGWILATIGSLAGTIAALATIMWAFMKSRLEAQDKLIESQTVVISKLQDDVDRMSKGCGADSCHWKFR
jgi:hypothetical protein